MRRLSALSFPFMPFCKQKDKHKKPYSPCSKAPCSCKPYVYYSPNQKRHCHIHHSFAIASAHLRLVISLSLFSHFPLQFFCHSDMVSKNKGKHNLFPRRKRRLSKRLCHFKDRSVPAIYFNNPFYTSVI